MGSASSLEAIPQQGRMFRATTDSGMPALVSDARWRSSGFSSCATALLGMEEQGSKDSAVHGARNAACADFRMGRRSLRVAIIHSGRRTGRHLLHDLSQ